MCEEIEAERTEALLDPTDRAAWRTLLSTHRHSALLAALIFAFAVRPIVGNVPAASFLFSIMLLLVLVVALYSIEVDELIGERVVLLERRRRRAIIAWVLGGLAVAERVLLLLAPSPAMRSASSIGWLLFFAFLTGAKLRDLLRQKRVTSETISLSIAVYLLLGATWGLGYVVLFLHQPDAFVFQEAADLAAAHADAITTLLPTFGYFSLATLSTNGFGDITPVSMGARYAAVAEGIVGQMYLAILVARLVSLQITPDGANPAGPET